MIKVEKRKTQKDYLGLDLDSSSSLRLFARDRRAYYSKYIIGEDDLEEEDTKASIMGSLVDCLLLTPEEVDERFYLSTCGEPPTGQMYTFVNNLAKKIIRSTDSEGIVRENFEKMAKDAHQEVGSKRTFEYFINNFKGKEPEIYLRELLATKGTGRKVICENDKTNANKIIDELSSSPYTSEIINMQNSDEVSVYNQAQVEEFEIEGLLLKMSVDKALAFHEERVIFPYDLKCVWSIENFFSEYFIKKRGDIQALVYTKGLKTWAKENGYEDYRINPLRYIVCDSINYYSPLIYKTTEDILDKVWRGYTYNSIRYKGVQDIIKDLKWSKENALWRVSRENHEQKGQITFEECLL